MMYRVVALDSDVLIGGGFRQIRPRQRVTRSVQDGLALPHSVTLVVKQNLIWVLRPTGNAKSSY